MRKDSASFPPADNRDFLSTYRKKLRTGRKTVDWYDLDAINSTMDIAARLAEEKCRHWTVVSARLQLTGRGTHGRSWESSTGKGLWMSVVLPPPDKPARLDNLSVMTADALIRTFGDYTDLVFAMKHPNDVTAGGRKIAGILYESSSRAGRVDPVVLGMGVNFLQTAEDFERCGLHEATSLYMETGLTVDRRNFLETFLKRFIPMYESSVLKSS